MSSVIGRHARLELAFGSRGERTVLAHAYAEPPFRIGRTFDLDGALYLILVCEGPGIFGGDQLHLAVTVESGARVLLVSQAALQVHPSTGEEPARVVHQYLVEDGGELHCQWDPMIPFAGARVVQQFDLQIAGAGRLYWSDALMSGRCSRGEAWMFRQLAHELRLTVGGSLMYLERYQLGDGNRHHPKVPDSRPVLDLAGGANYLGTGLVRHPEATGDVAERIRRAIDRLEGVRAGVDRVEPSLIAGRFLADAGPPFSRARALFRDAALAELFKTPGLVVRR